MITLISSGTGEHTEPGQDVSWVRDSYTEPREAELECCDCGQPVEDQEFWTCLDGGEAAHGGCVRVITWDDMDMLRSYSGGPRIWDAASLMNRVYRLAGWGLTEPVHGRPGLYQLTEAGRKVLCLEDEGR